MGWENVTEGQYSLLDRGKKRRTDKDNHTLGDGKKGREMDGWMKRVGME